MCSATGWPHCKTGRRRRCKERTTWRRQKGEPVPDELLQADRHAAGRTRISWASTWRTTPMSRRLVRGSRKWRRGWHVMYALRAISEARGGIANIATATGLSRETLYRYFEPIRNPRLSTLLALVRATRVRLRVEARRRIVKDHRARLPRGGIHDPERSGLAPRYDQRDLSHASILVRRSQSNSRNCCIVRPASRTIPPIVMALTGLWRGMVRIRDSFPITTCLPWRRIANPAFSSARMASR